VPTPFEVSIHARWPDMDQNGHMRTVAYLEVAEDSRMQYFASRGYSMDSFVKHHGARFRLSSTIVRADGRTAATVTSSIGWLDLAERRLTTPPADLLRLVADLPRTEDFAELPPLASR
jgi:acyl-CoA thioester hydrolase